MDLSHTSKFYSAFKDFSSKFNPDIIHYVKKTWLPLAPQFFSAWKKEITNFDHGKTSRIESSHTYIKQHLLNSNSNFPEVIKLITLGALL